MQQYINTNTLLGAAINQTLTASTAPSQTATGIIVNRQGFYSIDVVVPYHGAIASGNSVAVGLMITQSDTSSTLAGATAATLLSAATVFSGISGTVTVDSLLKYGFDLRSYNQYMKIQPYVIFSATSVDTMTLGEVIILANVDKGPSNG